jgi:hypothetical protein
MSQYNINKNNDSDSKTNTKKITNNDSVRQTAVRQNPYNTNFNTTPLSQKEGKDSLEQTHSNNLSDREKILEMLKQDRTLREQVEILNLLGRIREEGLVGDARIYFRVSYAFKELYDKYYAPKKPTYSPKTQAIREAIFRIILDDLIVSGKVDAETLRQLGFEIPNLEEVRKAERVVYMPIIQKEEEKENEEEPNEFELTLNQFEEFLNKFIFREDNKMKNNGYIVTKPLKDQLFEYLNRLIGLSEGSVREELINLKDYLSQYPLNEMKFNYNNLPIAVIPIAVYKEIYERLGKVKAHLRH